MVTSLVNGCDRDMGESVIQVNYEGRIKRVLEKLLETKFKVKNDVYLNSLLSYFVGKTENNFYNSSAFTETFVNWIIKAKTQWQKSKLPPTDVLVFALNLAAFISKEEIVFVRLNGQEVYEGLIDLIQRTIGLPSIKLAYIELLSAFLEHKSGKQWIIATNYWSEIMSLTIKGETHYISKAGYKFLSKLLCSTIKLNERFCVSVVQMIIDPLINFKATQCNVLCQSGNNIIIQDQAIYQSLCGTLTLTTELLEIFLENVGSRDSKDVLNIFVEKFQLETLINNVLMVAQSEDFVYDLNRVLCILALYEILVKLEGMKSVSYEQAFPHIKKLFKILMDNIHKGYVANVLKLCYMTQIYYKSISSYMPVCTKKEKDILLFENQIMLMQITPMSLLTCILFKKPWEDLENEMYSGLRGVLSKYYYRNVIEDRLYRMIMCWRDLLFTDMNGLMKIAKFCVGNMLELSGYISKHCGMWSFQSVTLCIGDYLPLLQQNDDNLKIAREHSDYFELLFELLAEYAQDFDMRWQEFNEMLLLLEICVGYLELPGFKSQLVVKALKLVDISIKKYMTPNMALLVDRTNDSTLALVGPLLYAKLHDSTWEVRDTALEVICTLAYNANNRFPSFQKIILDAEIVPLVVKMALGDGESYVRATALKCLQEIIQVADFWEQLMKIDNLHEDLLGILEKEPEGIVRQEAAMLMSRVYEHQSFPDTLLPKVFDVMSHAATSDLHWEVKVNALNFWEKVINSHLQHQGMIDGSFPEVTFSKEHKKIVTLNEQEVRKRLVKVLGQLSEVGCLAVLVAAIQDDCDVEVSKVATNITKTFVELLKKYNVTERNCMGSNSQPTTPSVRSNEPPILESVTSADCVPMSTDQTDRILDEIINAQDAMLLSDICNPTDQPMVSEMPQLKRKQVQSPSEFVKFSYDDLETYENEKRKWLNNIDDFGSLLEDILKDYNEDTNSMDCY